MKIKYWDQHDAYYEQRKRREHETVMWFLAFSIGQSIGAGIILSVLAAVYALISWNWAIFSIVHVLIAIAALVAIGPIIAWHRLNPS